MFKLFKKKERNWKVVFKNHKGSIVSATIKAEDKDDVMVQMNRIFRRSDVIGIVEG